MGPISCHNQHWNEVSRMSLSGYVLGQTRSMACLEGYEIGLKQCHQYVTHWILCTPSNAQAPTRHKKLQTIGSSVKRKKKMPTIECEQKMQIKCLRKRLAWCARTGNKYNSSEEQYSTLPHALNDPSGKPHTGCMKNWTNKLETRYSILRKDMPVGWKPDAVLMDGKLDLPTSCTHASKPRSILCGSVSNSIPGHSPLVMNSQCWYSELRKAAFLYPLKNDT